MATNHIIGASSTSTVGYLEYTRMSMRNSWTGAGVEIDVYLSSDANLSAGDARVYSTTLAASSFAAGQTSTTSHIFSFNPQVAMPAEGTTYCFIVQMDRSNVHSEFAEDDNVMDTQVCYTRM